MPFIFRAGVWKPRTSPHTFQGVGEEGLEWLKEVKERFGIAIATEVATPEHVQKALAAGIDYLWIGARSSANPMVVEAIAKAIADRDAVRPRCCKTANAVGPSQSDCKIKGILIKNPVNEDAGLWLGNIERLEKVGVPVIAVHRGCNHQPCWAMAHKVRLARPDIPMLLDPSHMSGEAAKIPELMQKIEELGLDGAMIEVHCCPEQALSDAKQQVTPKETATLLDRYAVGPLCCRTANAVGEKTELNWLRAEIDELDDKLWDTIAARMDVSRRIGEWKKANGVAPLQPERYEMIRERLKNLTPTLSSGEGELRTEFKLALWELIHEESLRQQE